MDIFKLLLERVLSWPVITLVTFLVFKKPLTLLLNRINTLKAGKEGFSLDASIAAATTQANAKVETGLRSSETDERIRVAMNVAIPPSVQRREELIRTDLQKLNLDRDQPKTIDLLIRHLALVQALARAEQVYRIIFGSQIALLRNLNAHGGSAPRVVLEAVYEAAKSRFPDAYRTYSFQQWVNYLLSQDLLSTNDNEQFAITGDGREFLQWMTAVAVTEDKPF